MEELDLESMEKAGAESPFVAKFQAFFETQYMKALERLVSEYPQKKSLYVDFKDLEHYDFQLADELLVNPDVLIEAAETAIQNIDIPMLELEEFEPHARFFNLPKDRMPLLRNLGSEHIGKLICIEGIVAQMNEVLPKIKIANWQCRRCGNVYKKPQDGITMLPPVICECKHKDFLLQEEQSEFVDNQKLKIQEPLELVKGSEIPTVIDINLSDDLVNRVAPGDRTKICGVLRLIKPKEQGAIFKRYLEAIHIEETAKEFDEVDISKEEKSEIQKLATSTKIYDMLIRSVAPTIYGHENVKEAIILQLFGGVKKVLPNNTLRGNIHILLVGDPGCLVADERIVLGNGAIEKIGNVGTGHLEEINLQVLTGEGGRKRDTANVFHFYKNQRVMEIITESGKSIKGTFNHPLLCVSKSDGKVSREWKQLQEFKIGDKVAVVTKIPCTITASVKTNFEKLPYSRGPKFCGRLPQTVNEELGALLGYLVGDGWVKKYETNFIVSEQEIDILPKLLKMSKQLFGIKPSVKERKLANGRKVQMHCGCIQSNDIAQNLFFLREKRIPDLILRSGNKVAAAFLKWLFEADGCVFNNGRGKRAVSFKAKNIELLRDVQMLLLRFGIHSRITENALQIRRGKDIIKFSKKIGFASKKKLSVLKRLAKDAREFARLNSQRSERIVKIIHHAPEDVFDIEVPNSHRFIANGIISHNTGKSQTLQAVKNIAPKAIYTAGKTTTGAGISATAVKDDFGEGGWTLKAGALVLASGGMCMVDELDKMEAEDRSALHESMEQGVISVAKAGIVARLKTETSILAAANPKFARFDMNEGNLMQQVNLPSSLISRFDLFFMIHDVLDRKKDQESAEHVLKSHRAGEMLMQQKTSGKMIKKADAEEIEKFTKPEIESELLKKYISYARQNVFPVLSKEATEAISDYYVNLREQGKKEGGTYSATLRQLEGLVRLSEASARIRLSDIVETNDTERAIRLVRNSLQELVTDKETGKIDIDLITTGQAQSQTNKMRKILQIISSKAKELDRVPVQEVIEEMKTDGVSDEEVRDIISKLKKKGDIYEPGHGFVLPTQKG